MIKIFKCLQEWQQFRKTLASDASLGIVMTMGNLHAGHASLLRQSKAENTFTLLTLFVNPTQFDNANDLEHYPRTLTQDLALATELGVDFILLPEAKQIYADEYRFRMTENELSKQLCGQFRPGHFEGALTVILKLLMLANATRAYFGEKDWQQLQLVQDMVNAFFITTQIIGCPIIRDQDGLALSSRNSRLTAEQRQLAAHFPRLLQSKLTSAQIQIELEKLGFQVDYITEIKNRRLAAIRLGDIRLIDNVSLPTEE